jgi:hypothetical protein
MLNCTKGAGMSKEHFKTAFLYQIQNLYQSVFIALFVLSVNAVIGIIIGNASTGGASGGSNDIAAIIFMFLIGVLAQGYFFKYCLYNGTSRKTYFWATLTAVTALSVIVGMFTAPFMFFAVKYGYSFTVFSVLYKGGYFAMWLWITFALVFAAFLGWFEKCVYDILPKLWRYIVMTAVLLSFSLIGLWSALSFETSPMRLLLKVMSTPYWAGLSFAVLSALFGYFTYLIIKRQEIQ